MPKEYQCTDINCGSIFFSSKARRRHVHECHGPLPDVCLQCAEPFLAAKSLEQHMGNFDHSKDRTRRRPRRRRSKKKNAGLDFLSPSGIGQSTVPSFMMHTSGIGHSVAPSYTTHQTGNDLYSVRSENLNSFISTHIQPDESYLRKCGEAADRLVNFLQNNAPGRLRPRRVIKGGSLCKGTAVKGKSDLDVTFMLSEYTDVRTMVNDMDGLLRELDTCMRQYPGLTVCGKTHRCLQIEVNFPDVGPISADVLPAVDLLEIGHTKKDIYEKMGGKDHDIDGFYSPCLAPLQRELFAELPTKLKSLVRLMKYWIKDKLKSQSSRVKWPSSYAIELVVLNAFTEAGEGDDFDMTRGLHAVLTSLVNHENFRVIFDKRMFYERKDIKNIRTPYMMDPCNPFNNVYYKGSYAWNEIAEKAKEWLQKPLFYGTGNTSRKW